MIVRRAEPAHPGRNPATESFRTLDVSTLPDDLAEVLLEARKIRTEPELYVAMLRDWVAHGTDEPCTRYTPDEVVARARIRATTTRHARPRDFELGQHLHRAGDPDACGTPLSAKLTGSQPDNWTYKRQRLELRGRPSGPHRRVRRQLVRRRARRSAPRTTTRRSSPEASRPGKPPALVGQGRGEAGEVVVPLDHEERPQLGALDDLLDLAGVGHAGPATRCARATPKPGSPDTTHRGSRRRSCLPADAARTPHRAWKLPRRSRASVVASDDGQGARRDQPGAAGVPRAAADVLRRHRTARSRRARQRVTQGPRRHVRGARPRSASRTSTSRAAASRPSPTSARTAGSR